MDDVLLDSYDGLEMVPMEILNEGTNRTLSYLMSLSQSNRSEPIYRSKVFVIGPEGAGKTTLVHAAFPLGAVFDASEGLTGLFFSTPYYFHLQGNRLRKYPREASSPTHTDSFLEEAVLEADKWKVEAVEGRSKAGLHLWQVGTTRHFYLYIQDSAIRDTWVARLRTIVEALPTRGVDFSRLTIDHPVISQAIPDQKPLQLAILDFSGKELYFHGQQLLFQPRSVYLVVWNMAEGDAGIQKLKPWLVSLAARFSPKYAMEEREEDEVQEEQEGDQREGTSPRRKGGTQVLYSIIVIGTHSDLATVDQGQRRERTQKIKKLFREQGLRDPIDCLEISLTGGAGEIDRLQAAVYFAPLTHSYMGEKLPRGYQLVEEAVAELFKGNTSFPVVPVEKVAQYCLGTLPLDQGVVRVALRLLNAWGTCLFLSSKFSPSRLVALDPSFYLQRILFSVLSPDTLPLFEDGVLPHAALDRVWPTLAPSEKEKEKEKEKEEKRKEKERLFSLAIELLTSHDLCFPVPKLQELPFLSQASFFPQFSPPSPPKQLQTGDPHLVWWPPTCIPGFIEISQVIELSLVPRELPPRLFARLHKSFGHKTIWKQGFYFEKWTLRALVLFEEENLLPTSPRGSEPEVVQYMEVSSPSPDSRQFNEHNDTDELLQSESRETPQEAEPEEPSHQGQLPKEEEEDGKGQPLLDSELKKTFKVFVRGIKRVRCRNLLETIIQEVNLLLKDVFPEIKMKQLVSSPHDPSVFIPLDQIREASSNSQEILCPGTQNSLNPQSLLVRAGEIENPEEKGFFPHLISPHLTSPHLISSHLFCSVLFCSVLFCSVLFSSSLISSLLPPCSLLLSHSLFLNGIDYPLRATLVDLVHRR